ncbi:MAG: redox-regulated ATPase YchF [Euryarchaeota archaeon]|nr:redox-regulated ATPase YchF [Euryarchaeota archaeon]
MRIGLVGKPNVGKSTTFSALTETAVEIANYPFTTIDPNVGVSYLAARNNCACKELREKIEQSGREAPSFPEREGSICEPRSGACVAHQRLVPVTLVDVAGLVPGAHQGRGRGNQFLSDLASCDALIQVVDASGSTDIEGNPIGEGGCTPQEEYEFLVEELAAWIDGIVSNGWAKAVRRIQSEGESGLTKFLMEQLNGIGAKSSDISQAIEEFRRANPNLPGIQVWADKERRELSDVLRRQIFPLYIAANKSDLASQKTYAEFQNRIQSEGGLIVPCSAETELALRRAAKAGAIIYSPGSSSFEINLKAELNDAQRRGLSELNDRIGRMGGTGLNQLLSEVVYEKLDRVVAYPVQDETHWTDGDGKVLPDALVVPFGTNAKQLAYAVHSDLGDGFIRAIDARSGMVIGSDSEFEDSAVIKIHAKT